MHYCLRVCAAGTVRDTHNSHPHPRTAVTGSNRKRRLFIDPSRPRFDNVPAFFFHPLQERSCRVITHPAVDTDHIAQRLTDIRRHAFGRSGDKHDRPGFTGRVQEGPNEPSVGADLVRHIHLVRLVAGEGGDDGRPTAVHAIDPFERLCDTAACVCVALDRCIGTSAAAARWCAACARA